MITLTKFSSKLRKSSKVVEAKLRPMFYTFNFNDKNEIEFYLENGMRLTISKADAEYFAQAFIDITKDKEK